MVHHFLSALILTCVFGSSLVCRAAHADQAGPDYEYLKSVVEKDRSNLRAVVVFDQPSQYSHLEPARVAAFQLVAKNQAKVWADTILEGDYAAEGQTRLDRVEALLEPSGSEVVVAYRITYSEKAWYTADCDARRARHTCEEGRIREASFVSPSHSSWLRDDTSYADFASY